MWPVHPHGGGERLVGGQPATSWTGSSPRPWGTQDQHAVRQVVQRFIPTPVGNALPGRPGAGRGSVHPHARGERGGRLFGLLDLIGSSPRPWGTRLRRALDQRRRRFIPTPVGNASSDITGHLPGSGSSPRPWGTPSPHVVAHAGRRFIPTPVGNATRGNTRGPGATVHPHARGERICSHRSASTLAGSSPRPWGTPLEVVFVLQGGRFIPTPVGNADRARTPGSQGTVHPHARGERLHPTHQERKQAGSSPRPWGTRQAGPAERRVGRFIPTPVGNARHP